MESSRAPVSEVRRAITLGSVGVEKQRFLILAVGAPNRPDVVSGKVV